MAKYGEKASKKVAAAMRERKAGGKVPRKKKSA